MGRKVKLSPAQVQEIRENPHKKSLNDFAREFAVSKATVLAAKQGKYEGYAFQIN